MTADVPVWRSMLFVPVTNQRHISSARRRGADAIQLDLEDSIPADRKAEARSAVATVAAELRGCGADVVVRINRPWRMALADIEASVGPDVHALNLPKVPEAGYVRAVAEVLDEIERERGLAPGHTRIVAMIETAQGLLDMAAIAGASPRVAAMTIGAEDLALDMEMQPEADALYAPNVNLVAATRAAGILPIGYLGTVAEFADREAFRQTVQRARRLGFAGGFCIHPNQVDILNEAFRPSSEDLAKARALIDAYDKALGEGRGAVAFENRMIDQPVADRARAVLAQARRIAEKDRLKREATSRPAG